MMQLDKRRPFPISLKRDAAIPEDQRPALLVRPLTLREYLDVTARIRGSSDVEAHEQARWLLETLERRVAGRRNLPDGDLAELITMSEAWELVLACNSSAELEDADRKNSGSPPTTSPAASADPAK